MVEQIRCDHCGAMANAKYVVTKEFDGKELHFCCRGCLQAYELLREAQEQPDEDKESFQSPV